MAEPEERYDVCGILVHASPENTKNVEASLNAIKGVEVHHITEDHRLVVTVETTGTDRVTEAIDTFNDIDGVVSSSLVYQHAE